jgi:GH25 family lysozyme M1 (1,4-beta-N-acetylmuramidase)
MNLIDIASYQHGISLPELFEKNPALDGVIVKVSQGTGYVNPFGKKWLDWLTASGKPAGTYHYLDLMGAEEEARYYVESVRPWLGKAALAVDYEGETLKKGPGYLKACLDEVYRLTGIRPFVYCSQVSCLEAQDFSAVAAAGYPLWVAQYADYASVRGFLAEPWHRGSPKPFAAYAMRQYTSCGRLAGWGKNLDFDLFYGSRDDWQALCGEHESPPELKGPDPTVVSQVLMGYYGIGDERSAKLRADGYDPQKVQDKINELYGIAGKIWPIIGNDMDYINSIMKIVRSI